MKTPTKKKIKNFCLSTLAAVMYGAICGLISCRLIDRPHDPLVIMIFIIILGIFVPVSAGYNIKDTLKAIGTTAIIVAIALPLMFYFKSDATFVSIFFLFFILGGTPIAAILFHEETECKEVYNSDAMQLSKKVADWYSKYLIGVVDDITIKKFNDILSCKLCPRLKIYTAAMPDENYSDSYVITAENSILDSLQNELDLPDVFPKDIFMVISFTENIAYHVKIPAEKNFIWQLRIKL